MRYRISEDSHQNFVIFYNYWDKLSFQLPILVEKQEKVTNFYTLVR